MFYLKLFLRPHAASLPPESCGRNWSTHRHVLKKIHSRLESASAATEKLVGDAESPTRVATYCALSA